MRLVSFEVQTTLGKFERIGALAHDTIVDLNAACTAYFATSQEANAARRQALALVPPDMIAFLEGGAVGREAMSTAGGGPATRREAAVMTLGEAA